MKRIKLIFTDDTLKKMKDIKGNIFRLFKRTTSLITSVYSWKVVLIYFLFWIVFYQFPLAIVPDYLNLSSKIESGLFNSIIGNFSSILGIILTFFILTFGILRERLNRFALGELLHNIYFRILVTLTLTVFLFNILSLLILNNDIPSRKDLTLAYFLIISTIFYLIALIPLILVTINSINPKEIVIKKINALKHEDYPKKEVIHFEHIDDNPILIIRNLLNSSFRENDVSLYNQILYSTTLKTCDLINENKANNDVVDKLIKGLLVIWKEYSGCSIRNKVYNNLSRIFESLEYLHVNFSKNEIYLRLLNEVDFFIKDLLRKAINELIFEPIQQILFLIERLLIYHYENSTPPEGEIPQLIHIFKESYLKAYPKMKDYVFGGHRDPYIERNIQWDKVSHELPYYLNIILFESIKNKRSNVLRDVFHAVESIERETIRSSTLGRFQKDIIIRDLQSSRNYYQIEAIKYNIVTQPSEIYNPNIDLVNEAIDSKYPFVINIIKKDFEFLKELNQYKMLDLSIDPAVYFGAIGRHCMINIEKDRFYRLCMFLIINEIEQLKEILEKEERNKENVKEIFSQVESFNNYYNYEFSIKEKERVIEISEENYILMNRIYKFSLSFKQL